MDCMQASMVQWNSVDHDGMCFSGMECIQWSGMCFSRMESISDLQMLTLSLAFLFLGKPERDMESLLSSKGVGSISQ